jgi:hypothetical protein
MPVPVGFEMAVGRTFDDRAGDSRHRGSAATYAAPMVGGGVRVQVMCPDHVVTLRRLGVHPTCRT